MTTQADSTTKHTILAVDDAADNLRLLTALLKDKYRIKVANNGERALKIAFTAPPPDLILLDVVMPGIDGYEVCRRLKADAGTRDIPVIFLTSRTEVADEQAGFDAGAVDYISKPISAVIMMARVQTHLTLKSARDLLRDQNAFLEKEVGRRVREVLRIQGMAIIAMASLAETRDNETGNYISRAQNYVKALAVKLKDHPRFKDELSDENIEALFKSAALHDSAKTGIADGLSGGDVPLPARLMAVADVYDALIGRRVYKRIFSHEEAVEQIAKGRARHFDPDIVDAFMEIAEEFRDIARRFADSDPAASS